MNVTVERIADSQVRLQIAAGHEEHSQAVDKAYRRLARDIVVPGFRKGKAPRSMIERVYGREVFVEEANRSLMDDLYRKALEQEEIIPVGDPEVDSIEPEPLSFVVIIPVYPTVDPGDYTSVRIEPVDAAIEDSAVDEMLHQFRVSQSPWVDPPEPRKPKDGDQVTLDIQIMDGEEEFQPVNEDAVFILGDTNLLEELRAAIDTLDAGEAASTDIAFGDDDDRIASNDPRRGKIMTYNVTLKGVKERDLLALDDDFANNYGDAESFSELRERIYGNAHSERTGEARSEAVNAIFEQLNELATLEVPSPMIDEAVTGRVSRLRGRLQYRGASLEAYLRQSNQSEDQLKADIRPVAAKELRTSLILREIAKREGIEVTDTDLESEIEEIASGVLKDLDIRDAYEKNESLRSALRNDLFDRRLTDRLIEIAAEGQGAVLNAYVAPEADASDPEMAPSAPAAATDLDLELARGDAGTSSEDESRASGSESAS